MQIQRRPIVVTFDSCGSGLMTPTRSWGWFSGLGGLRAAVHSGLSFRPGRVPFGGEKSRASPRRTSNRIPSIQLRYEEIGASSPGHPIRHPRKNDPLNRVSKIHVEIAAAPLEDQARDDTIDSSTCCRKKPSNWSGTATGESGSDFGSDSVETGIDQQRTCPGRDSDSCCR